MRVIVSGDQTAGADSALACVLRTVPPAGADGTGTVARCTNPVDVPPVLELSLPPGAHRLRALRSACPGMPGDCSNDPYAEQYALDSAEWSCEVDVAVSPRSTTEVRVEVSAGPPRAECTTA